ncbi:MipA/OmpV family protein [Saccharospirillum mangrovi]|uniref:MipA/OmpV family protein n=1 Tax=Saccharospirillum mangrovi TaxID=2161747 RepID=UPI0013009655|nr:MipA/OmpV family protein [Saccharospirillum mangrovi]
MIKRFCSCVLLLSFVWSSQAAELSVGLGAAALPPTGDDNWRVFPAPSFRYENNGYSVASAGLGIGTDLVPNRLISLGPLMRYNGGRDEAEVPDIPASAEVGLAGGSGIPWKVIGVPLPGILTVGGDIATSMPGGHESMYGTMKFGWVLPTTDQLTFIGNLGFSYFSDDYSERFFSLNASDASAAGVEAFDADGGWQEMSVGLVTAYRIKPRWSTILVLSRSHYIGDAADSPVTDLLDDQSRYVAVVGVNYQWLGND